MRAVVTMAATELRRFMRDRSNIFFVFIFPLLLVVVIGSQFGGDGSQGRVAVAGGASDLRDAVAEELRDVGVEVTFADADVVREQLARGRTDVGLLISEEAVTSFADGGDLSLEVILGSQGASQVAFQRVQTALDGVATTRGQVDALVAAGAREDDARGALAQARETVSPPSVTVTDTGEVAQEFAGVGGFDLGASSQLLLFVFLISLAGSATLIQARRYGVIARTLAAPVSTAQVVAGQALGRWVIAVVQGVYIMAGTALLFDVDWGNLGLSLLLVATFAAVASGAGMVIGSVMDNDSAASGLGVGVALVAAALGGCMFPLELFPDTLQTVAHITPHAWAYEAFAQIQRHDGTLVDILPQLGVLAAFAAVLLGLGAWFLRGSLDRAI